MLQLVIDVTHVQLVYTFQVTVAFWRAMGGDEDEIGNLSDSD